MLREKQLRQELDRGLSTLPLEQRAVFVLYELEGFTLPEIAEAGAGTALWLLAAKWVALGMLGGGN